MRYAYLLLFTTFMFASCLDESPKSSLDDQQAYTSAKDVYLNTVANLYNYIGGDTGFPRSHHRTSHLHE